MTPPPESPSETAGTARPRTFDERPRPGGPRVVAGSLCASVLLHALAAVLLTLLGGRGEPPPRLAAPPGRAPPEGIEVLRLSESAAPPEAVPDEPREPETRTPAEEPEPAAPEAPEVAEEDEEEPAEGVPTAAERLRPPPAGTGDARIWRPVAPELTALSPEERARLRVYGRLESLADSLLTEEERARAAREWTYTDDDGKQWGITPGKIHLGDLTLPLPFSFSRPPSVDDAGVRWEWDDVRRGAGSARVWDTWDERSEAIRERKDAERADTSSTGSP